MLAGVWMVCNEVRWTLCTVGHLIAYSNKTCNINQLCDVAGSRACLGRRQVGRRAEVGGLGLEGGHKQLVRECIKMMGPTKALPHTLFPSCHNHEGTKWTKIIWD
jgi:hypothetical protein